MSVPKKGWKVVDRTRGMGSWSCLFEFRNVFYLMNEWVKPQKGCGPLCVFETKLDALRFLGIKQSDSYMIKRYVFPCLYYESKKKFPHDENKWCGVSVLPPGTVLASRVMLIKSTKK